MSENPTGVLLMAYGTPENLDQVEAYFTHIRGGKTPSPESVAHLRHRYELVGGKTPLLEITEQVRTELQEKLDAIAPGHYRVYTGMKHWHPYIGDVLPQVQADGVRRVIALALAPHYSQISIGGYRRSVDAAQEALGHPFEVDFVNSWHMQPDFLAMIADHVRAGLAKFPVETRDETLVVFTAHSLPERIRTWNDPYEAQLLESSAAVASMLGLADWRFAWQSAGGTGEPWIGPDIVDYLDILHAEGIKQVLQVPIGFVADHLEIMYDIDIEAKDKAAELGMKLERTELPNATPAFISTLAAIVTATEEAASTANALAGATG